MSERSTTGRTGRPRPPRLERLLIDADMNPEMLPILEAIGFNVELATRVDVDIQDDEALVDWARKHQRVLICHDRHKDRRTKVRFKRAIRRRGGRVITVYGGSEDPYAAVGRLLTYRARWRETFIVEKLHGLIYLGDQNYRFHERSTLTVPTKALDEDLVIEASARLREYEPPPGRNRRRNPPRGRAGARLIPETPPDE